MENEGCRQILPVSEHLSGGIIFDEYNKNVSEIPEPGFLKRSLIHAEDGT